MADLTGRIKAICISKERGTVKEEVNSAVFKEGYGIEGDAHAGNWHRQVSLLSASKVDEFNERGAGVKNGEFGENLLVEDIDVKSLPVGSLISIGDATTTVKLKVTQRGKECHTHCRIYQRMGECIMPTQGIFAEVVAGGRVSRGDRVSVDFPALDAPFRAAVLVLSDKGAAGQREDLSGPAAAAILAEHGYEVIETLVIPDDKARIKQELIRLSDGRSADLIITSGGTGFSLRDNTPEATMEVAERSAPGIAEYIRMKSCELTDRAMLSRGVSVIRGTSVIVNLPGSPKAVKECLEFILNPLDHGLKILRGSATECASDRADG